MQPYLHSGLIGKQENQTAIKSPIALSKLASHKASPSSDLLAGDEIDEWLSEDDVTVSLSLVKMTRNPVTLLVH